MNNLDILVRKYPDKLKILFKLINTMKPKGKYYQLTINPKNITVNVYDAYMNEIGEPATVPIPNDIFVTDTPIKCQSMPKNKWKNLVENPDLIDLKKIIVSN